MAAARHGDSGGPMFNSRGELAGVLFGEGGGDTSGSYCGRVRVFLDSIGGVGAPQLPARMLAAAPPPRVATPATSPPPGDGLLPVPQWASAPPNSGVAVSRPPTATSPPTASRLPVTAAIPSPSSASRAAVQPLPPVAADSSTATSSYRAGASPSVTGFPPSDGQPRVEPFTWEDFAGHTWGEQFKTILAGAGIVLLLMQVVRWVA